MSTLTPSPRDGATGDRTAKGFAQLSYALLADPAITPAEKVILAALLRFGWKRGRCFPANDTIAEAAGVSARTVGRVLPKLVAKGLISIEPTRANPTRRVILLDFMSNPAIHPERAPRVGPARPSPLPRQSARAVTRPSCPPPYVAKVADEESGLKETSEKTAGHPFPLERPAPAEASEPREGDRLTDAELATFRKVIEQTTGEPAEAPGRSGVGPLPSAGFNSASTPGDATRAKPGPSADVFSSPTMDRLAAVHRGCSSRAVTEAADSLVRELGDPGGRLGFLRVLNDVRAGARAKGVLVEAYAAARAPGAVNPGRRFLAAATAAPPPGSVLARLGLDPRMFGRGAT